jgi:hypothetical protein
VLHPGTLFTKLPSSQLEVGSLVLREFTSFQSSVEIASQSEVVSVGVAAADGVPEVALSPRSASAVRHSMHCVHARRRRGIREHAPHFNCIADATAHLVRPRRVLDRAALTADQAGLRLGSRCCSG